MLVGQYRSLATNDQKYVLGIRVQVRDTELDALFGITAILNLHSDRTFANIHVFVSTLNGNPRRRTCHSNYSNAIFVFIYERMAGIPICVIELQDIKNKETMTQYDL